jgi:hypothetical protein
MKAPLQLSAAATTPNNAVHSVCSGPAAEASSGAAGSAKASGQQIAGYSGSKA